MESTLLMEATESGEIRKMGSSPKLKPHWLSTYLLVGLAPKAATRHQSELLGNRIAKKLRE
jgi:hypothetical protein